MVKVLFWAILGAIAFSAAGPLGPVVVGVVWYVVAYLPQKKAAAREEARLFQESSEHGDVYVTTIIDFEQMTMASKVSSPGTDATIEESILERKGEGRWRHRLTEESVKEALERYLKREFGKSPEDEQKIRKNAWRSFDGHFCSRLEVAYQQYLKTL